MIQKTLDWISERQHCQKILMQITQPLTATQLSKRTEIPFRRIVRALEQLSRKQLLMCVNERASQNRLYFVSPLGKDCQQLLCVRSRTRPPDLHYPEINWELYAWVCFRHRSPILLSLKKPMRPAQIKKWIREKYPSARISADNIWDALQLMLKKSIVKGVSVAGSRFVFYEPTRIGRELQALIIRARRPALSE